MPGRGRAAARRRMRRLTDRRVVEQSDAFEAGVEIHSGPGQPAAVARGRRGEYDVGQHEIRVGDAQCAALRRTHRRRIAVRHGEPGERNPRPREYFEESAHVLQIDHVIGGDRRGAANRQCAGGQVLVAGGEEIGADRLQHDGVVGASGGTLVHRQIRRRRPDRLAQAALAVHRHAVSERSDRIVGRPCHRREREKAERHRRRDPLRERPPPSAPRPEAFSLPTVDLHPPSRKDHQGSSARASPQNVHLSQGGVLRPDRTWPGQNQEKTATDGNAEVRQVRSGRFRPCRLAR